MEKQIITVLMALMVAISGWVLKETHELGIAVNGMQVSHADKDAIQEMKLSIQRLEIILLNDAGEK